MCNINQEYKIAINIEKELTEIMSAGCENIPPWKPPSFKEILHRYGIEYYLDSSNL
jgi:hypothetical protein